MPFFSTRVRFIFDMPRTCVLLYLTTQPLTLLLYGTVLIVQYDMYGTVLYLLQDASSTLWECLRCNQSSIVVIDVGVAGLWNWLPPGADIDSIFLKRRCVSQKAKGRSRKLPGNVPFSKTKKKSSEIAIHRN